MARPPSRLLCLRETPRPHDAAVPRPLLVVEQILDHFLRQRLAVGAIDGGRPVRVTGRHDSEIDPGSLPYQGGDEHGIVLTLQVRSEAGPCRVAGGAELLAAQMLVAAPLEDEDLV